MSWRCRCGRFVTGAHHCPTRDGLEADRTGQANSNWRGGKSSHPLYLIYHDMIARCHRPTHQRFASYGGRGITVCDRWREDFWAFVADMGERPRQPSGRPYLLDRIDNDGPYAPDNCRWVTDSTSARNRRPSAWEGRGRDSYGRYA